MKKRRALLFTLLILLFIGIPMGFVMREYRHEQLNRDLIAAIKANDTDKALAALKGGSDPNARDHSDDKPLTWREHATSLINKIVHPHPKTEPDNHPPALLWYLRQRDKDDTTLIKALLNAGADPNLACDSGLNPTFFYAADSPHLQNLRLLLQYGGNVHLTDDMGWTVLHVAASADNPAAILLLLDAGANINAQAKDGTTPLHQSCSPDHKTETAIPVLLQHHANPNMRDNQGYTPLDWVWSDKLRAVEMLRKAGAKTGGELYSQDAAAPKR